MNPSTGHKDLLSGDVLVRAVARKLRNWLNNYLMEHESSGVEQLVSDEAMRTSDPTDPSVAEMEGSPLRPGQSLDSPDPHSYRTSGGPPEDWLERVRKGAPELLLHPDEGGTPYQSVYGQSLPTQISMAAPRSTPTQMSSNASSVSSDSKAPSPIEVDIRERAIEFPGLKSSLKRTTMDRMFSYFSRKSNSRSEANDPAPSELDSVNTMPAPSALEFSEASPHLDRKSFSRKSAKPSFVRPQLEEGNVLPPQAPVAPSPRNIDNRRTDGGYRPLHSDSNNRGVNPAAVRVNFPGAAAPIASATSSHENASSLPVRVQNGDTQVPRPVSKIGQPKMPPSFSWGAHQQKPYPTSESLAGSTYRRTPEPAQIDRRSAQSKPSFPPLGAPGHHATTWESSLLRSDVLQDIRPDLWPDLPEDPRPPQQNFETTARELDRSKRLSSEQQGDY